MWTNAFPILFKESKQWNWLKWNIKVSHHFVSSSSSRSHSCVMLWSDWHQSMFIQLSIHAASYILRSRRDHIHLFPPHHNICTALHCTALHCTALHSQRHSHQQDRWTHKHRAPPKGTTPVTWHSQVEQKASLNQQKREKGERVRLVVISIILRTLVSYFS